MKQLEAMLSESDGEGVADGDGVVRLEPRVALGLWGGFLLLPNRERVGKALLAPSLVELSYVLLK